MSKPLLGAIWAQSLNGVIGRAGTMPWYVPEDLAHFKRKTLGSVVVMGRGTWDSFPPAYRPLPGRENLVLSRRIQLPTSAHRALWFPSFERAVEAASALSTTIWLIGGSSLFDQVLPRTDIAGVAGNAVTLVERTVLDVTVEGDSPAPVLGPDWSLETAGDYTASSRGWVIPAADQTEKQPLRYRFERWRRPPL